jgi:hypothetical protein
MGGGGLWTRHAQGLCGYETCSGNEGMMREASTMLHRPAANARDGGPSSSLSLGGPANFDPVFAFRVVTFFRRRASQHQQQTRVHSLRCSLPPPDKSPGARRGPLNPR